MNEGKIKLWFVVFIPLIVAGLLILLFSIVRFIKPVRRELSQREIRPMFKKITGLELPNKTENLRAIFLSDFGVDVILLAFQTDQDSCSYILDTFSGHNVQIVEFPKKENNPALWKLSGFMKGYRLQKELGVDLFDKNLIDRITSDTLEQLDTGRFPKDAVSGYYLALNAYQRGAYRVLVFKDRGIIYMWAEKP